MSAPKAAASSALLTPSISGGATTTVSATTRRPSESRMPSSRSARVSWVRPEGGMSRSRIAFPPFQEPADGVPAGHDGAASQHLDLAGTAPALSTTSGLSGERD